MADIFISYAREDPAVAAVLAKALEGCGLSVWWDRVIPPGKTFDEVIETELTAARCAIVLWSKPSIASRWVREEAQEAADCNKLVPAMLDGVAPPMGFRRIHAADLAGWRGNDDHPGWQDLKGAVGDLLGHAGRRLPGIEIPRSPKNPPAWARHLTALLFGYLTALLFGYVAHDVIEQIRNTWCSPSDFDCAAWIYSSRLVFFVLVGLLASVMFVGLWFSKSVTLSQRWRLCSQQVVLYSLLPVVLLSLIAINEATARWLRVALLALFVLMAGVAWWWMQGSELHAAE